MGRCDSPGTIRMGGCDMVICGRRRRRCGVALLASGSIRHSDSLSSQGWRRSGRCEIFEVEQEWRWSGRHNQRTAEDWLANFDANQLKIDRILGDVYGADATLWRRRWRLFFLAAAGLFGHANGEEWGVSHYRLRPAKGSQN